MEALLALDGVGVPTASTLLHVAAPARYPMLDVRALDKVLWQHSREAADARDGQ